MSEKKTMPPNTEASADQVESDVKQNTNILDEIEIIDIDETLKKYDTESNFVDVRGFTEKLVTVIALAMSAFHLYIASPLGRMPSNKVRLLHLAFVMCLIFLLYPMRKKKDGTVVKYMPVDFILAIGGVVVNLYLFINIDAISLRAGVLYTTDIVMAVLTVILVLEAARRCVGKEMCILAILFLCYAYFGKYLPGALMHRGFSLKRLADHMYVSPEGIYGIPLGTSATVIFLFILFGAFLSETGLGEFFTNISMALAGDKIGGPAKVSIIASGFLGMISGSAAANVVTTGAFTIPLMKKLGYKNHYAGAVEAVASTGGQIMPPVMGAAAFIMAEYLSVPYRFIMITALIPAILYYVSLWINVHFEAMRLDLKGIPKNQLPNAKAEFKKSGHLIIPIFVLIGLLMMNFTPAFCAFFSIISLLIISYVKPYSRMTLKKLANAMISGAKQGLSVGIACAVVGLVVGVVSLTGLGLQLANMIINLAGGNLLLTLILTMVACVILGMGMPTSAAYIVAATVATSAITTLNVSPVVAHMFVLYYAALSAITPPVALASFAGAGLADASPNKVGWTAVRIGILGFIIPFMFAFSPPLLMLDSSAIEIIWAFITACVGCYCLGASTQGYMLTHINVPMRAILFVAAMLMIKSGLTTDIPGIVILAVCYLIQKRKIAASVKAV